MTFSHEPGEPKDLGQTIVEGVVKSEPAHDLGIEVGEIAFHQLLDEGVWREVPVIRSVVGIVKTAGNVRDALFVRKVASFLLACPNFTEEQRETFAREHLGDPKKAKNLGDTLVLILDRLDDLDKPPMVGKAFAAVIRNRIPLETFRRLAGAIEIGFAEDLNALASKPFPEILPIHELLARTALVALSESIPVKVGAFKNQSASPSFRLTNLGKIFIGCMNENYEFGITA